MSFIRAIVTAVRIASVPDWVTIVSEPSLDAGGKVTGTKSRIARGIALSVVVLNVVQIRYWLGLDIVLLGLVGLVAVLCLNDGHAKPFGMKLVPRQGWWYWWRLAFLFGFWIGLALMVYVAVWLLLGKELPVIRTYPSIHAFVGMCVHAPVAEEVIYRVLLIAAVLPTVGKWSSIVLSGTIFAMAHVLGGNASPENQIAGFMLAWAYLESETILVPIAMHSGGNLIALGSQVAGWYWSGESF